MLKVDTNEFHKLERKLELVTRRGVPAATREVLNNLAFETRKLWQREIPRKLILRNKFTVASIRVDKARGSNPKTMYSVVGSIAPWMYRQEFGGLARARRKHLAIPQVQARSGRSHRRKVKRSAWLSKITVPNRRRSPGATLRERNLIRAIKAKRAGRRYVLLERRSGGKGLYEIMRTKKRIKVRMLYDLSHEMTRTPPSPTLAPALQAVGKKASRIMKRALLRQFARYRIA